MPISDMVRVTAREHPDTAASESAVIFPLKRANTNETAMIMPEILTAMICHLRISVNKENRALHGNVLTKC